MTVTHYAWTALLAGKTIERVEIAELDTNGRGDCVLQLLAFVCTDGSIAFGQAIDGDAERQYATFAPVYGTYASFAEYAAGYGWGESILTPDADVDAAVNGRP